MLAANVSICVRAGLPKPRGVPDTERIKDTKTLDYASTPLDANTVLYAGRFTFSQLENTHSKTCRHTSLYLRQTHLLCYQSLLCLEV